MRPQLFKASKIGLHDPCKLSHSSYLLECQSTILTRFFSRPRPSGRNCVRIKSRQLSFSACRSQRFMPSVLFREGGTAGIVSFIASPLQDRVPSHGTRDKAKELPVVSNSSRGAHATFPDGRIFGIQKIFLRYPSSTL